MVSPNAVPFGKHEDNRAQEAGVTEVDAPNSEVVPVKADDAAASESVKTNGEVASSNSSAV